MARATLQSFIVAMLLPIGGCGGSSSETPFPPEPLDVNLEAEDMATSDPYRAARPGPPTPAKSAPAEAPASSAKPQSPATASSAAW